jgi:hypothetical protein
VQVGNVQTEGRGAGARAENELIGDSSPQKGHFVNERVWTFNKQGGEEAPIFRMGMYPVGVQPKF